MTQGDIKLKKRSSSYLLKKLDVNELEAEWMSAKAKISYQSPEETRKFTANIRIRKDSIVWMNIKKASVEAFRILVTTDSVYIINRIDKEYYIRSLDFAQEQFNLPGEFEAIQTALLGNPFFFKNHKLKPSVDGPQYKLSSDKAATRMLTHYYLNGLSYALEKMFFQDLERSRNLTIFMDAYEAIDGEVQFAHERNFQMESEETGEVEMKIKFSKVEINVPKTIKFSISSRYKRVD